MDSVDRLFAWVGSGESQELLIRVAKNNKEKRGVLITSVCQYSFASRKYESMWKLNQVLLSSLELKQERSSYENFWRANPANMIARLVKEVFLFSCCQEPNAIMILLLPICQCFNSLNSHTNTNTKANEIVQLFIQSIKRLFGCIPPVFSKLLHCVYRSIAEKFSSSLADQESKQCAQLLLVALCLQVFSSIIPQGLVHDKESIIGIVSERYSKLSESETLLNAAKVFLSCCKQDEEIEKIAQTNGFSDLLGLDDGDLHQRKHIWQSTEEFKMLRSEVLFLLENISKSLQNEAIGIMFQERGAPHAIFALYSSQMLEAFEMVITDRLIISSDLFECESDTYHVENRQYLEQIHSLRARVSLLERTIQAVELSNQREKSQHSIRSAQLSMNYLTLAHHAQRIEDLQSRFFPSRTRSIFSQLESGTKIKAQDTQNPLTNVLERVHTWLQEPFDCSQTPSPFIEISSSHLTPSEWDIAQESKHDIYDLSQDSDTDVVVLSADELADLNID